jgi:hypothetical protein
MTDYSYEAFEKEVEEARAKEGGTDTFWDSLLEMAKLEPQLLAIVGDDPDENMSVLYEYAEEQI